MTSCVPRSVQPAALDRPIQRHLHPVAVYLGRLQSESSRETMLRALGRIADLATGGAQDAWAFPWPSLRYTETAEIRRRLLELYSPRTANKLLCALRGVLRESWRIGYMTAEAFHRAVDVKDAKVDTGKKAGRALSATEMLRLFQATSSRGGAAGARDAALVALLYGCGLRRAEAVSVDVMHYSPTVDGEQEGGSVEVAKGKGGKTRTVPVPPGAKAALDEWLRVRGDDAGPLLLPVRKGGKIEHRRMSAQAVREVLQRLGKRAGVEAFTAHDLRRSFVGDLLEVGVDLARAQELAGHSSPTTTVAYDRRGEREKHRAAMKLNVPYVAMN